MPFPHVADYWFIAGGPITIEIVFSDQVADPIAVLRHIRLTLRDALIHEEGCEGDRVFVRATLTPGQYAISLAESGEFMDLRGDHRILLLQQGASFRLMGWEPGRSPEVMGEYFLPLFPYSAALEGRPDEALFGATVVGDGYTTVYTHLWQWRSDAEPQLTHLGDLWPRGNVFSRSDDLVIQFRSAIVVDRSGERVATLEYGHSYGVAVGPGDEIAVFLGRYGREGRTELDLMVFNAELELYRTWDGIYPQGRSGYYTPDVHPIWWENELFFLVLDDAVAGTPVYRLMAIDVDTGSLRRVLGPFVDGYRVGRFHYAFRREHDATWALWDPATRSLWTLVSAHEVGEWDTPRPLATNGDWVVLYSRPSGLLGWHPSTGITRLGPGTAVVRAGDGFLWWTGMAGTP
ncbi:MAG: hypothetical protein RDU89_11710 [bacterium]|nr:hypothetical protein [bacterium]